MFTAENIADDFKPVIPFSRMANYYATPILPLASGKVRYVGEAIVAVVATSRYLAEDALELIEIEFEPLGAVARSEQAVAEDAPLLHEEAGTNVLIAREFKKGDVEADLKDAAVRVSGRFEMTRKAPLAMEPRSYTAEYDSDAAPSRSIPRRTFLASFATRFPSPWIFPAAACGWSRPTSAAASDRRGRSIRRNC